MPKNTAKERSDLTKKALDLLRAGHNIDDVATLLHISTRTIQRWRRGKAIAFSQPDPDVVITEVSLPTAPLPTNADISDRIQGLTDIALRTIEGVLQCRDTRTADKLRACQLILDASGHNDPAACVVSKAIDFLHRQGYIVTDPTVPPEAKPMQGLSDEVVQQIKERILFN